MVETLQFECVIPCFNEAESLSTLIKKFVQSAQQRSLTPRSFQLVLVDNGSQDRTQELLKELKESEWGGWFSVVRLEKNLGYGGGIYRGLQSTRAPWVGFTHADLQCEPQDAIKAFLLCRNNPNLIKGRRKNRHWFDWMVSRSFELSVGIIWGFWRFDLNAQPKIFSRELIEKLENPPAGITFDAFVLWSAKKMGIPIREIEVTLASRSHGSSHWNRGVRKRLATFIHVLYELCRVKITAQSQSRVCSS